MHPDFEIGYAFVQDIVYRKGVPYLKVIDVLELRDTELRGSYDHNDNELYMSDQCNCGTASNAILLADVMAKVDVSTFSGRKENEAGFFMRFKYVSDTAGFTFSTLKSSHFICACRERSDYNITETESPRKPTATTGHETDTTDLPQPKLRTLDLFAGCGGFIRGLESCGLIDVKMVVEMATFPIHSYLANSEDMELDRFFFGSINDYMYQVLQGDPQLPKAGSIDFIVAGSPFPGYTTMNVKRFEIGNAKARQDRSLLAAVLSAVELYRPMYVLLENVMGMNKAKYKPTACQQAVCALKGMGYQVRKMDLNALDFESIQNRERIFIFAIAPDLSMPSHPSFYRTGERSQRLKYLRSLPKVDNDTTHCIPFPNHIPGKRLEDIPRSFLYSIPPKPGMSLLETRDAGHLNSEQDKWLSERYEKLKTKKGKDATQCFTRQNWDRFIPTVTTACEPRNGIASGRILHPDQARTLTQAEVEIAQNLDIVLVGPRRAQWHQIGNTVDGCVSPAIGKTLRESLITSITDLPPHVYQRIFGGNEKAQPTVASQEMRSQFRDDGDIESEKEEMEGLQDLSSPLSITDSDTTSVKGTSPDFKENQTLKWRSSASQDESPEKQLRHDLDQAANNTVVVLSDTESDLEVQQPRSSYHVSRTMRKTSTRFLEFGRKRKVVIEEDEEEESAELVIEQSNDRYWDFNASQARKKRRDMPGNGNTKDDPIEILD